MTKHFFAKSWLFKGNDKKPPVPSWVSCKVCGTKVAMQGKGNFIYSELSSKVWDNKEPECKPNFNIMKDYLVELSEKEKLTLNSPLEFFISHLSIRQERDIFFPTVIKYDITPFNRIYPKPVNPDEVGVTEMLILLFCSIIFSLFIGGQS